MQRYSRRAIIRMAGAAAMAALSAPLRAEVPWLTGKQRFIDYPFKLGVASGDPTPTGFVLWTRLAPDVLEPRATGPDPIVVGYEVAADENFTHVVKKAATLARPENAHAVHVDIEGLLPNRPYWYRFMSGEYVSPVGRAVTVPTLGSKTQAFRCAVASCQNYEEGYFTPYRDMIEKDVDLIVHLGDYIYEYGFGSGYRRAPVLNATTLDDYRAMHAVYKTDEHLQAGHAHTSWLFTWDDHEFANDYAGDQGQFYEDPREFLIRRANAYKAYFEHIPVRRAATPQGPDMRLYQRMYWGDLVEFNMLDTRQYRSDQPCQTPDDGGWRQIDGTCAERFDPARTMLGDTQENWLMRRFGRAGAHWNVLAQGMLFSNHDRKIGEGEEIGSEYWDGYVESRRRVLDLIERSPAAGTIIIGGDVHATYVCDVKKDFKDPNSKTLASEFVTTSITSSNGRHDQVVATLVDNPHIKRYDGRYRGYTLCDVTPKAWNVDLRVVDDVKSTTPQFKSNGRYIVEAGNATVQEAS